jgi:addiction module RelB/DinJ family antitoxin
MKTSIINIKIDPETKKQAQKITENMGFSLSTVLNAFIRQMIKDRAISFSVNPKEEPSEWLINELNQAEKNKKEGWVSPGFTNTKNMMAWLKNPKRRYANGKIDNDN